MSRLILMLLFVALFVMVAYMILWGVQSVWRAVDKVEPDRMTANETLNRLAFGLLVALILYVSVWGAG